MSNLFQNWRQRSSRPRRSPTTPTSPSYPPNPVNSGGQQRPLFLCDPYIQTQLVKGSIKTIVVLPKYVDVNEWLALNEFEFFQHLNQFYGVIAEVCTNRNCPSMSAGPGMDYMWIDNQRKQVRLPAPQYTDFIMTNISNRISNEELFPTKNNSSFPSQFHKNIIKPIHKQMFRIFAHVYWAHFETIIHLRLEAHWNSFFAHFISFAKEFELLDAADIEPLKELIEIMEAQGQIA